MRIIYFSRGYTAHDHQFLSALAKTAHQVMYLRLENDARPTERRPIPEEIMQWHWAGGQRAFRWSDVPRLAVDLKRVIGVVHPDLIHAGPIQTCAFLSALSGFKPVVSMSWAYDLMQDAERDAWWRWVTRYTLRHSTFFVSDAQVTRARAIDLGMRPERTAIFPWGVDLKSFAPGPPKHQRSALWSGTGPSRKKPLDRDAFVLFCNRSWEPRYGVEVLAQAFVSAARRNPRLALILLGSGSRTRAVRQILTNGGVIERVSFGGHIAHEDLPRWYHMADLFISPSHIDGSSVSLMEALACGLPVLVSDIPANKEWVCDGMNGWLFPDGNAEALADRILTLAASRGRFARVRRAARKSAEEKADWNKNFQVLLQAYEQAMKYK